MAKVSVGELAMRLARRPSGDLKEAVNTYIDALEVRENALVEGYATVQIAGVASTRCFEDDMVMIALQAMRREVGR